MNFFLGNGSTRHLEMATKLLSIIYTKASIAKHRSNERWITPNWGMSDAVPIGTVIFKYATQNGIKAVVKLFCSFLSACRFAGSGHRWRAMRWAKKTCWPVRALLSILASGDATRRPSAENTYRTGLPFGSAQVSSLLHNLFIPKN